MKKISLLVLIALCLTPSRPLLAVDSATADFLRAQAPDAWVTMALVALGQPAPADHLSELSSTTVISVSKFLLARVAATADFNNLTNSDLIDLLHQSYSGGQLGDPTLVNDDFWGLIALGSVNDTFRRDEISQFILTAQNADGGWSYAVGGESDTNDTAAALMALVEAGYEVNDAAIVSALNYLTTAHNADGGMGYQPSQTSDGASTAWVIAALNKLGINSETWHGASSRQFLASLRATDGSYRWLSGDQTGSVLVTSYAAVALSDSTFPVARLEEVAGANDAHIRIEGPDGTICEADIAAATALAQLEAARSSCAFELVIEETSFGPYVRSINGFEPTGTVGWLYRVNWLAPAIGADQYQLEGDDDVFWYYSDFNDLPVKLSATEVAVSSGGEVRLTAEFLNEAGWQPLAQANISDGRTIWQADGSGQLLLSSLGDGVYAFKVLSGDGLLPSNTVRLTIGQSVSDAVNLVVDVIPTVDGIDNGDIVSFRVDTDDVNFGRLRRGEQARGNAVLVNQGSGILTIGAQVSGDNLFIDNLSLDGQSWRQFNHQIEPGRSTTADVSLSIPDSYSSSGVKTGDLIFWARPQ